MRSISGVGRFKLSFAGNISEDCSDEKHTLTAFCQARYIER